MDEVNITETTIRITNENAVEITTHYSNGTKNIKNVSFQEFMEAIVSSKETSKNEGVYMTPTFTNNDAMGVKTIKFITSTTGVDTIFIVKKAHRCDITYYSDTYHNVGIPDLVFAISLKDGQFRKAKVLAVANANNIDDNTPMYFYPFSNVSNDGRICFGRNHMISFEYKDMTHLHGFPSMFLSIPNNDDSYGNNNSGMAHRPLLIHLQDKDFPIEFLKKTNFTFGTWAKI